MPGCLVRMRLPRVAQLSGVQLPMKVLVPRVVPVPRVQALVPPSSLPRFRKGELKHGVAFRRRGQRGQSTRNGSMREQIVGSILLASHVVRSVLFGHVDPWGHAQLEQLRLDVRFVLLWL